MKRLIAAFALLSFSAQAHPSGGNVPDSGGTMTINLLGPITSETMAELLRAAQEREDAIVNGWYDRMLTRCLADPVDFRLIESYKERDMILDTADLERLGFSNAPFEELREKKYFGRATNIVPRIHSIGSEGRR